MPKLMRSLTNLAIPLGMTLVAWLFLPDIATLPDPYLSLIALLPYALMLLVLVVAYQFNRSRLLIAGVLMGLTYVLVQHYLQTTLSDSLAKDIYLGLTLLLSISLICLVLLPECGVWNRFGLLMALIAPVLGLLMWFGWGALSSFFTAHPSWFELRPIDGAVLPLAPMVVFALLILASLVLIYWRGHQDEIALLACGVSALLTFTFFYKPMISATLFSVAQLSLLLGLFRGSFDMAYRDELTGLLGRRALNERLRAPGRRYVIAMLDVDHFKKFNDTHGHDVGDEVLRMVASRMAEVSGGGLPYRYGGEEFCIVFPNRKLKQCVPHLEALREEIADYPLSIRDRKNRPKTEREGSSLRGKKRKQKAVHVTISIGVAERSELLPKSDQVIKAADKALYQAKGNGRNCLASYSV